MLSGLNSVSATGVEYYFAGIETGETPRWFVGDRQSEYAEYKDGQLNIKGRLSVLKSDGTYQSMSDYINQIALNEQSLQAQIDGQIQSWSGDVSPLPIEDEGSVDPSTANYPANQWTTDTERLKHMGDIYVNNTSGQGYRYTRQANNGDFYWMRISDEEVALALERANQALSGVAGMQYLTAALGGSTLVQGGLVLTSLIQLGKTESGVFNVYSGINGTMDANAYGNGIAAWYGGPMTDHEADPTAPLYANSLFRFDGSGYLAGGLLKWGVNNGQAFLTLNGEAVVGGMGGATLNDIANLMFEVVQYETGHYAAKLKASAYYGGNLVTLDGLYADGFMSAGGLSSDSGIIPAATALGDLSDVDVSTTSPVDGDALTYSATAFGGQGGWVPRAGGSSDNTQFVFAQSSTDPGDPSDGGDSTSWRASADVSWITLAKSSGSGSDTLSYTVAENTTTASRTGRITITYSGGTKTLTISQAGVAAADGSISPTTVSRVSASGSSLTFTVTDADSVGWTLTSNAAWLTLSTTSGAGGSTVTATVAANTSSSERSASLTFASGGTTTTIAVSQKAAEASASISYPDEITSSAQAVRMTITDTANHGWLLAWFDASSSVITDGAVVSGDASKSGKSISGTGNAVVTLTVSAYDGRWVGDNNEIYLVDNETSDMTVVRFYQG